MFLVVPGPRDARGFARVTREAPDLPVVHPQLGGSGSVTHYRYPSEDGSRAVTEVRSIEASSAEVTQPTKTTQSPKTIRSPKTIQSPKTIDILAVQTSDVLPHLRRQLETGDRQTRRGAGTFLIVPELSVTWNTTTLRAEVPASHHLAAIQGSLPEPVTVLAGGQPTSYHHEWSFSSDTGQVNVSIVGLGATGNGNATSHGKTTGNGNSLHRGESMVAQYTCTTHGTVAHEEVDAGKFGLRALHGVGRTTARRLHEAGCQTTTDVRNLAVNELAELPGIGSTTAQKIHAHADVIESGEPLLLTNKAPVKTRDGRPPVCLDIETDGLSPTIIWQFGVYDPVTDSHQSFIETDDPTNPKPVLEAFMTWFLGTHGDRTVITWNGYGFDYPCIETFLRQYLPAYLDAWADVWTYDLYKWAVRDGNALLPGRTNKLDHVARALGYDSAGTGLSGAQTAAAYREFMRQVDSNPNPNSSSNSVSSPSTPTHSSESLSGEPDWDRHEAYCEDDCRALWHVYESITTAPRRDMTDSGTGGTAGQQAGLTDF